MNFSEWIQLNEDGYVFFKEPVVVDLGNGEENIDLIDLRLEIWYSQQGRNFKPPAKDGISLQTKSGWINASKREGKGLYFFDADPHLTPQPMYEPFYPGRWQRVANTLFRGNFSNSDELQGIPAIQWTPATWQKAVS